MNASQAAQNAPEPRAQVGLGTHVEVELIDQQGHGEPMAFDLVFAVSIEFDTCSNFLCTISKDSPYFVHSVLTPASMFQTSLDRFWIASVRKPI